MNLEKRMFVNISSYEGLSFSLIEAMMKRKACIVSNIEGNTAVITDNLNGLVIPLGSKSALVESIKFCISNPEKERRLARMLGQLLRLITVRKNN